MAMSVTFCAFVSLAVVVAAASAASEPFPPLIIGPPFNCSKLPPPPPATDVRHLRPGNIKAVMATGDSISAGFAMKGILPLDLLEYRSHVFSIGGVHDAYTIFKFIEHFNPKVVGGAMGPTIPLTKGKWLDGAVSHASVQDVPAQIDYLVNTLKTEYAKEVDFQNDWKLLTIFIGANNLCSACSNDTRSSPAYFEQNLRAVLTQVHQQIPRVFVNLVSIFNISGVWDAGQQSAYCRLLWHNITTHECGCLTTGVEADRKAMDIHGTAFNQISAQLADEFAALNDPNFTVVLQPGLSGIEIATFGESYLSKLDCFHPSLYANEAFTYMIWNNMMSPVGQKATGPDLKNITLICPTQDSFLQ